MERTVKIDSLAFGACGVGRIEGKVVFVPYTAPGDEVRIRITREERGHSEGEIAEIVTPSPSRRETDCRYHSICGGCHWLHIPYEEQVRAKGEIFRDTLRRIGRTDPSIVLPARPSPQKFNYRNRVQFKVWERKIGFYRRGTHELVDISECPLAHPLINKTLSAVRANWPEKLDEVARVDINISPSDEKGIVSIYLKEQTHTDFDAFFRAIRGARAEVIGLITHLQKEEKVYGSSFLYSDEEGFRFRASEGAFSQVNYIQNLRMKECLLDLAGLKGDETVLELYAGGGNFTIPIAKRSGRVFAVEVNPASISDAEENMRMNGISNTRFIRATSEKGLKILGKEGVKKVELVVVDPPRDGCSASIIKGIAGLRPEKIIYVSCNPSTLSRDLARLSQLGFTPVSSTPIDMFPQTYHIESITEIVRNEALPGKLLDIERCMV